MDKILKDRSENPEDELSESSEEQTKEKKEGTEGHDSATFKQGVTVPEDFQKKAFALVKDATKQELDFLYKMTCDEQDKLRKSEDMDLEGAPEGLD